MTINLTTFDPADFLNSPEAIAAYLEDAIADADPAEFQHALGVVARAKGMSAIASESGLARGALYRSLSSGGRPEFSTVLKVLNAIGVAIHVSPAANTNVLPSRDSSAVDLAPALTHA
jgi:probable addiction module antidote protein